MKKIIFCDKNKELVKEVKKLFNEENLVNNTHCELIVSKHNDVFKTKEEYKEALIVTASNPDFSMGGGLDLAIKNKYPEQCKDAREFKFEKDVFFTITVDKDLKATKNYMMRAMFGCYMASRKNDIIISGLGTGIGGLNKKDFIIYLKKLINSNFNWSNFSNSNFRDSNFRNSDFRDSDFSNSDFSCSDFRDSDFRYSNFSDSNFSNSNFRYSNFRDSNFSDSNFSNSNFRYSNFSYSDFRDSNFSNSDFGNSDFRDSNFSNSDFRNSDFRNSDFCDSIFNYRILPDEGSFIGWKKSKNKILKLEIQDAKNVSGGFISRKCRTNKVKLLEIQDLNGKKLKEKKISSDFDDTFIYEVGKIIKEKKYIKDDKLECEAGIHFFITRDEAVRY